jgi:hypothetical protein
MKTVRRAALWLGSTVSLFAVTACSPVTIHGFTLTAAPASVSVPQGGTSYLSVASVATSNAPVTAAIVLYNLPPGVTASPASPTVTTGSQTTIALTAVEGAPIVTSQVSVAGYAGLAYGGSAVSVSIVAGP